MITDTRESIEEALKRLAASYVEANDEYVARVKAVRDAQMQMERAGDAKLKVEQDLLKHVGANIQERNIVVGAKLVHVRYTAGNMSRVEVKEIIR